MFEVSRQETLGEIEGFDDDEAVIGDSPAYEAIE